MVLWFLPQNAVADISVEAGVLVSLCCQPCQSLHESNIYPWSDHPTSQSSNHLRLVLWTWTLFCKLFRNFAILKIPVGWRWFILKRLRLTTYDEVMWIWTRPWWTSVIAHHLWQSRWTNRIFLTSLWRVLYFVPCRITPHIFSMRLILPQFSSLHSLFFLTYNSVTHL